MILLMINTFREKIRNKTFYIVCCIGMLLMLLITSGRGSLSINGRIVTGFEGMVPVSLSILSFTSCLLAVMTSLQTIPNEFERKTSHLILIRGIKPWQYMFSLTSGNILASVFCMLLLMVSLFLFCILNGKWDLLPATFLCVLVLCIPAAVLSSAVSLFSIKLPVFAAGICGLILYVAGMMHGVFSALAGTGEGSGAAILRTLLFFIPDFSDVLAQASALLTNRPVDFQPVAGSLLLLYLYLCLTFVAFRKEV